MTQAQQLADLSQAYTAGALGFRNRFINGSHIVNQRGSQNNPSGSLSYCGADRWYTWPGGSGTIVSTNDWQCPVSLGALHFSGVAGNTGIAVGQRIERANMYDMLGKTATLSGWVYVPVAGQSVAASVSAPKSNDAYGSGWDTVVPGQWVASNLLATTWTYFKYSFLVPSSCATGMQIELGLPACVAGQNAAIGGMQLELGPIATPFEERPFGLEHLLCLRYYLAQQVLRWGYPANAADTYRSWCWSFPVPMRASPTLVSYDSNPTVTFVGANLYSDGAYLLQNAGNTNTAYYIQNVKLNAEL